MGRDRAERAGFDRRQAVEGILTALPPVGSPMNAEQRDRVIELLGGALRLAEDWGRLVVAPDEPAFPLTESVAR